MGLLLSLNQVWFKFHDQNRKQQTESRHSCSSQLLIFLSFGFISSVWLTFIQERGEKIQHLMENHKMEMLKCINQLIGRCSWQQVKLFQQTASFLECQKVSGSPKLLNIFYHMTSIRRKPVLAITFMNLKTSTVRKSLHIQPSDPVMESKSTELNSDSILLNSIGLEWWWESCSFQRGKRFYIPWCHMIWVPCSLCRWNRCH